MKHLTQIIAAGGLAVPLLLLQWSGATDGLARAHRSGGAADTAASTQTENAQRDARAIFESKCASCHGKDGRAKTMMGKFNKARNLKDAAWQAQVSDERIYNSINNGRGKKMPAFAKKLSPAEVESLVVYVRGLKK
ncbi:MAG: hypothetical protein QOG00_2598 [Pyrinomonadaceae bacterium]|nr:hypothetical protein [Pyrinomonadaceae bacterium]